MDLNTVISTLGALIIAGIFRIIEKRKMKKKAEKDLEDNFK